MIRHQGRSLAEEKIERNLGYDLDDPGAAGRPAPNALLAAKANL